MKELGINNVNSNNPKYIPIDDSFEKVVLFALSHIKGTWKNFTILIKTAGNTSKVTVLTRDQTGGSTDF